MTGMLGGGSSQPQPQQQQQQQQQPQEQPQQAPAYSNYSNSQQSQVRFVGFCAKTSFRSFPSSPKNPCQYELDQFLRCAETSSDLSGCTAFREQLQQCKVNFGTLVVFCWISLSLSPNTYLTLIFQVCSEQNNFVLLVNLRQA